METLTDKSNFLNSKSQPTVGKSLSWSTEGSPLLSGKQTGESRQVQLAKIYCSPCNYLFSKEQPIH